MEALRERFGKYHVLEKLAQGGMAEVYKVKAVGIAGFEKIQALKRILPKSAREGRFIRSFIDEARIAVELTHRNIVQVFDFGKADGELFMAMELIEGKDLRTAMTEAVNRQVLPPIPVAAYIVAEVAQGLDYAHRKTDGFGGSLGIVHCDVSPSNVMLSNDGYVKILDFGIARASFASALERRRLRGKPRYMAPEQTLGEPPTAAADVFALGIIAWELLTGLPLFRGNDLKTILDAVRNTVPPPLDRINPQIPRDLVAAVAIALSREPEHRGTAADLAAACSRTAMAAGARHLAAWLGEVERRNEAQPAGTAVIGAPSDATSISVPPPRPSRTASMFHPPSEGADLGAGTPHSQDVALELDHSRSIEIPHDELRAVSRPSEPKPKPKPKPEPEPVATSSSRPSGPPERARVDLTAAAEAARRASERTVRREPTDLMPPEPAAAHQVTDNHPRYELTASAIFPAPRPLTATMSALVALDGPTAPPRTTASHQRWGGDSTVSTVGGVVDLVDYSGAAASSPNALTSLPVADRISATALTALTAAHHTSYDELEVEPEGTFASDPPVADADDQIDDDFGAMTAGLPNERRRAVVVFGRLTGNDRESTHAIARTLGELAYQRGGVVIAADDASVAVAFGLEVAGEDDVAVAIGWALDAVAIALDAGAALRVGARSGVLISDGQVPRDAIDDASALAHQAADHRALFAGSIGRLTGGLYALREVAAPPRLANRVRVTEVIGERGFDERDRARFERRGKFVGRAAQLAELDRHLASAIAAQRRWCVLIAGPAGTGKSRLVAELVARENSDTRNPRVVSTAASPASRMAPFALVIDLYQSALGLPPERGRHARRVLIDRLLYTLGRAGVSLPRTRAIASDLERAIELRDGVGIDLAEVADLRPRISAGLAAFRLAMTDSSRPLITIIEDLHHADAVSLDVLRHTLAVPGAGAELLVMTTRSEAFDTSWLAGALDGSIALGDLVGGELRALIADRLGTAATPLTIAAVLARAGGNPLFVEELAQAVRDADTDGEIPASARDVILARIERLSVSARAVLRFAAVLGEHARTSLLEELLGGGERDAEIGELVSIGLLERRYGDELAFARGLVREVVYDSLSARAQRDAHAQVGRLLASRFFAGREEPPAVIADHLERGGELAGAAAFWLRAGRVALAACDFAAAVSCFSRTLVLDREIATATPATMVRRREALAGREEAHRLQGDMVADAGDLDELERLSANAPARLADVAIRRAQRLMRIGELSYAAAATVAAEQHAAHASEDRLRGEALRVRGEIYERLGRFDEALVLVAAAREVFHSCRLIHDEMAAMIGIGRIELLRARYESARDAYRPVLSLIEKTGDPWLERIAANHVAVIELCLGNFSLAMASVERSLELCRRYGDRGREGDGLSVAGIILLEVGLYDQAAAMFADALALLERTASRWSRADCMIYAGTCEVRRGRDHGIAMLDEAVSEARAIDARYLEANALVARAGAQLLRGAYAAAITDATDGVRAAASAGLVGYQIQGLARQALARARAGDRSGEPSALANRAIALLDKQRYLEGSEEEVLIACAEVLEYSGAAERGMILRERALASANRKLEALTDPTWRDAFLTIPEIAKLIASQ